MSKFAYEVGDEFEGGAMALSRYLSEITAVGGKVEFEGSILRIVYLPPTVESVVEAVPEPVVEAAPEPVVKAAPEPVVEAAPEPEDPPLVDIAAEEAVLVEPSAKKAPVKKAFKAKSAPPEEN